MTRLGKMGTVVYPIKTDTSFLAVGKLEAEGSDELIDKCVKSIEEKLISRPLIVVYGKVCHQHRDIGFFSDVSIGYRYSGQMMKSQSLPDDLVVLLHLVNRQFSTDFNSILVNRYNDGEDSIGAHVDDEKTLGKAGVVAISVGSVRKFRIRDKTDKTIICDIPTVPYSFIQMGGDFQKHFTHEIPVEKRVKGVRYSFTFRHHLE